MTTPNVQRAAANLAHELHVSILQCETPDMQRLAEFVLALGGNSEVLHHHNRCPHAITMYVLALLASQP